MNFIRHQMLLQSLAFQVKDFGLLLVVAPGSTQDLAHLFMSIREMTPFRGLVVTRFDHWFLFQLLHIHEREAGPDREDTCRGEATSRRRRRPVRRRRASLP